jgi:integrase
LLMRWEDFDEQAGTLFARYQIQRINKQWTSIKPKRNSVRLLTLGSKLTAALRQYRWQMAEERETMGWKDSGYIFVSSKNGGMCPPGTIYDAFCAIIKAAGIEPARLHDMRHTAGTYLLTSGKDLATVSEHQNAAQFCAWRPTAQAQRARSAGTSSQTRRRAQTSGCHDCGGARESLRRAIQIV